LKSKRGEVNLLPTTFDAEKSNNFKERLERELEKNENADWKEVDHLMHLLHGDRRVDVLINKLPLPDMLLKWGPMFITDELKYSYINI
jgi:hypothetical protein